MKRAGTNIMASPLPETRLKTFTQVLERTQVRELFCGTNSTNSAGDPRWLFTFQKLQYQSQRSSLVGDTRRFIILGDPFHIPEVHEAIWNSTRTENSILRLRKIIRPLDTFLPLELIFSIFDFLGPDDVRKALASGEWGLPDVYWRIRFRETFLELDEWVFEGLDWQKLWLSLEPLKEASEAVGNRRRLLRIFHKLSRKFIEANREAARDEDISWTGIVEGTKLWSVNTGLEEIRVTLEGRGS